MKRELGSLATHRAYLGLPPKKGSVVPFPCDPAKVFAVQVKGLAARLKAIGCRDVVLGLSGGLDSTLALLVCDAAFAKLKYDKRGIHVFTMPGFGTSKRTKGNAESLCEGLGLRLETISIAKACRQHFRDIGHDGKTPDVTYENAQARMRTMILMDKANMVGGIVIGTGDLSEIALGWSTYNGDHMSMFAVNNGVPKTVIRKVCGWWAQAHAEKTGGGGGKAAQAILDIIATPVSPELVKGQVTEDKIGPYELHDFFLWNFIVNEMGPKDLRKAAERHFLGNRTVEQPEQSNGCRFTRELIAKTLRTFLWRFFTQAFKRNCQPDGIRVFPFELSLRGWWIPSDLGFVKLATFLFSCLFAVCVFGEREMSLGEYADATRARVVSKVREALDGDGVSAAVSGTVTYAENGVFFLQRDEDGLKVRASGKLPAVGDEVGVEGRPSLEGGHVVFACKDWKRVGTSALPAARPVTSADLVNGEGRTVNGLRVKVVGRTIGVTDGGFAMNVDDVPVNVRVSPLLGFLRDCDRTHPVVSVTGVAEQMLDQSILLGCDGYVMGVKVDVGSPDDVVLKPDLAYFAACRSRTVALAGVVFVGVLVLGLVFFVIVICRQRRGMFRTQTVMAERKRMADDIHDTIEQHLVGAGMLLKLNRIAEAQEILVRAKREIRDIVWGLKNDDMMRLSPAEMLRNLAHEENTKGLYRVDTRLEGLPAAMDAAAMRDLSLIVRESIGNAVKHGGAKKIAVSSDPLADGGWMLRISNDGTPFDPETAPGAKEGHFGLEGMKQRARRIGASVRFERRGKGMVLILEKRA